MGVNVQHTKNLNQGDDFIVVEKICFNSRVLAINVKSVHRVFPL